MGCWPGTSLATIGWLCNSPRHRSRFGSCHDPKDFPSSLRCPVVLLAILHLQQVCSASSWPSRTSLMKEESVDVEQVRRQSGQSESSATVVTFWKWSSGVLVGRRGGLAEATKGTRTMSRITRRSRVPIGGPSCGYGARVSLSGLRVLALRLFGSRCRRRRRTCTTTAEPGSGPRCLPSHTASLGSFDC